MRDGSISIDEVLRLARANLASLFPFFGKVVYSARLHVCESLPAFAAVDQNLNIWFNKWNCEQELRSWDGDLKSAISVFAWVIMHEISHVLREHARRGRQAGVLESDRNMWNVAADLEINSCDWTNLTPPKSYPICQPANFELKPGLLTEEYFSALRSSKHYRYSTIDFDEGSGVHGFTQAWESQRGDQNPPLFDVGELRQEVATGILKAAQQKRGSLPGGWLRWAEPHQASYVDWGTVLRRRLCNSLNAAGFDGDYCYSVPNRRAQAYAPFIIPGILSRTPDQSQRIAVVVDTSASMGSAELGQATSELAAILAAFRVPVDVIACDSVVHSAVRVSRTDSLETKLSKALVGGGGTDITVGLKYATEMRPRPQIALALTDGFSDFGDPALFAKNRVHVLWGIIGAGHYATPPTPPWKPEQIVCIDCHQRNTKKR